MKKYFFVAILFAFNYANSQIFKDEQVAPSLIKPWTNQSEYFGAYSFGFSEDEFSLFVWQYAAQNYVRIFSTQWVEDISTFAPVFKNFSNVQINGDKIVYGKK